MLYFAATSSNWEVVFSLLAQTPCADMQQRSLAWRICAGYNLYLPSPLVFISQQRLSTGTLRFNSLKFIYAKSGKGRDVISQQRLPTGTLRFISQQRLPTGTLRFSSLKFIYATSGKGRDVVEKKSPGLYIQNIGFCQRHTMNRLYLSFTKRALQRYLKMST